MNRLLRSIVVPFAGGAIVWQVNACKHNPAPPTEEDAFAVWKHKHASPHLADLVSAVQLGNRPPGTENTYASNYSFHWTEKGWMGPDNQAYPER